MNDFVAFLSVFSWWVCVSSACCGRCVLTHFSPRNCVAGFWCVLLINFSFWCSFWLHAPHCPNTKIILFFAFAEDFFFILRMYRYIRFKLHWTSHINRFEAKFCCNRRKLLFTIDTACQSLTEIIFCCDSVFKVYVLSSYFCVIRICFVTLFQPFVGCAVWMSKEFIYEFRRCDKPLLLRVKLYFWLKPLISKMLHRAN